MQSVNSATFPKNANEAFAFIHNLINSEIATHKQYLESLNTLREKFEKETHPYKKMQLLSKLKSRFVNYSNIYIGASIETLINQYAEENMK